MKELVLEELSIKQRLGMTVIGYLDREGENLDFILKLIREHSLGAVWIPPRYDKEGRLMAAVKAAADYPILVFTDAEGGLGEYTIGRHNAIGITGSEECAYAFGKAVAVTARKMGYNVVCDPVLDLVDRNMTCAATSRSLGKDKRKVASLAVAMVEGMHAGGVLSVAKHYPGCAYEDATMDSHMAETASSLTKEELTDYNLYPYIELLRHGLLDGIMTKHTRFANIDPDFPASLSAKVIGLIREQGFDGFALTDALCMNGILAKFGRGRVVGTAISGGNDLSLPYTPDNDFTFDQLVKYYEEGCLDEGRLNEAVRRVLEAQHKTTLLPCDGEITPEEREAFRRINTDSVYALTDEGTEVALSREGRHYFVVMTDPLYGRVTDDTPAVDTISTEWFKPDLVEERLRAYFPNSAVQTLSEYPTRSEINRVLVDNLGYEDTVLITYFSGAPYIGYERFTTRIITTVEAMQLTDRVSTVVHLGNPYVLEDLPHIPRVIVGCTSTDSSLVAIDVLAGAYSAKGVPTYDVKLK